MTIALFEGEGAYHVLRWLHTMVGVAWIGLLYYFNFVQAPFFAETDATTKNNAIVKLVPRALWWFRYAALATTVLGLLMLGHRASASPELFTSPWGTQILIGSLLGLTMAYNVWFVIWPNQKIVIASAQSAIDGKGPLATAAAAGSRALVASRTNVLFSIPMLFFMGAGIHLPVSISDAPNKPLRWGLTLVIWAGIEFNALKGSLGPLKSIAGVIHSGLALWVVMYGIVEFCL
jgi:uncharacterized membrane protein